MAAAVLSHCCCGLRDLLGQACLHCRAMPPGCHPEGRSATLLCLLSWVRMAAESVGVRRRQMAESAVGTEVVIQFLVVIVAV